MAMDTQPASSRYDTDERVTPTTRGASFTLADQRLYVRRDDEVGSSLWLIVDADGTVCGHSEAATVDDVLAFFLGAPQPAEMMAAS
jgi:hypothetical protein